MTVHDSVGSNVASADGQFTPQLSGVELQLQTKEDAEQVRQAFTAVIADLEPLCVQQEEALRAALQEIDELKRRLARERNTKRAATEEEHDQAVELLTQAQALADQLIDDAQAESRDMMLAARALQRKALEERKAVEDPRPLQCPWESKPERMTRRRAMESGGCGPWPRWPRLSSTQCSTRFGKRLTTSPRTPA